MKSSRFAVPQTPLATTRRYRGACAPGCGILNDVHELKVDDVDGDWWCHGRMGFFPDLVLR